MNRSRKTADLSCVFNGITDPRRGNDVELERINVIEQAGKGVAARRTVLQIHEPKQEFLLDFAEFDCFASRHDGQKSDHEHFVKVVPNGIAAPGIGYAVENSK